jgi:FkbH-like protein
MIYVKDTFPTLVDIDKCLASTDLDKFPILRITILRNITVEPIELYLKYLAYSIGYRAEVKFGGGDGFVNESIQGDVKILNSDTDFVFIFTPLFALSPLLDINFTHLTSSQINKEENALLELFVTTIQGIRKQTDATILWHSLEAPLYPTMGIQDGQMRSGQLNVIARLNEGLRDSLANTGNAYVSNVGACLARLGAQQFYDTRYWHLARSPYSRQGLAEIAKEDFKFIRALKGKSKKCIILDCDNTLWGGIVGEDGLEGIKLGESYPGSAFTELQQFLLSLYERGVILALCSKNNELDVWEVFDKHPDMILKREHIAAWRIDWDNKVDNIINIASELNIGIDSIVFVDDSDFEINLVKEQLPEVQTIQLPKERPSEFRWIVAEASCFDSPYITKEDKARGKLYVAERLRRSERNISVDMETYCRSLSMKLEVGYADKFTFNRIAQQTQRTNQFNLTSRRYTESDIMSLSKSIDYDVLWLRVTDKYADMGIVGSSIIRYQDGNAIIDTLLLSCRALGRGIEKQFLIELMYLASNRGAKSILGQYVVSPKNSQVEGFYESQGFVLANTIYEHNKGEWYTFELNNVPERKSELFVSINTPLEAQINPSV